MVKRHLYVEHTVASSASNWVMYHLKDGLDRVFMKKELTLFPEDRELLPDDIHKL